MQIHPFFKTYKEISRTPLMKDDRGVQYDIVYFEATSETSDSFKASVQHDGLWQHIFVPLGTVRTVTTKGFRVLSNLIKNYSNDITAYDDVLYWKGSHELTDKIVETPQGKVRVEEYVRGSNSFWKGPTMNTEFAVYVINE